MKNVTLRFVQSLLVIGLLGVTYAAASRAEWDFHVTFQTSGTQNASIFLKDGPIWHRPGPPTDLEIRERFDITNATAPVDRSVNATVNWYMVALKWLAMAGPLMLLLGIAYHGVRREQRSLSLDLALAVGLTFTLFMIVNLFMWFALPPIICVLLGCLVAIWLMASRSQLSSPAD
jgi:hypothetical protein